MGGMFSKHLRREQHQSTEAGRSSDNGKSSTQGSVSIIELMKPECLKNKKTKNKKRSRRLKSNPPEKEITKARKFTLEEWLLASPGPNNNSLKQECFNGGELHVFKYSSKRVHPSSSSSTGVDIHEAAAPRPRECTGSSMDVSANSSSISRSQSVKLKKKVSFRMPEETDIIIFYSPEEALESEYESF